MTIQYFLNNRWVLGNWEPFSYNLKNYNSNFQ